MSKITFAREAVEVKTVQYETRVVLKLTEDEAKALHAVLWHVGGHPKTTRRGLLDSLTRDLDKAFDGGPDMDDIDLGGAVCFTAPTA